MSRLNYRHLQYFYAIAKSGSIARAAEMLHITPQTLSAQLSLLEEQLEHALFDRKGKRLVLNELGQMTYSYAEEIFSLGDELVNSIKNHSTGFTYKFSIGVTDVIAKVFSFHFLKEVYTMDENIKLVCKETNFDILLAELAINKLDAILTDVPLPSGSPVRAYNHLIGECGYTFYSCSEQAPSLRKGFPHSMNGQPFFMAGEGTEQTINLQAWFDQKNLTPIIVGEFDDSALSKYFAQAGYGIICAPSIIDKHVTQQFRVKAIGSTNDVTERFYVISPERKVKHPAVQHLITKGKRLFDSPMH